LKTLIFNGSPKENGDTKALIDELVTHLNGEVKILSLDSNINPCVDCRYCWENTGCCVNDEMQSVYAYLEDCDNIVLASPIWFSSLSGPLLNLTSRIQALYAANHFQQIPVTVKGKKGVIIIVGAEPGTEVIPTQNALTIMKFMNVHRPSTSKIYSLNTNNLPACEDEAALEKCRQAAVMLNRSCV